jgi:hypothetical protein
MACSRAPVGQPEAAMRACAACRAAVCIGRGTVAEAAAGASSRRRLWAAAGKARPLPARIDVTDINHTVHASDKFGDFYRCGLRLRARALEQCTALLLASQPHGSTRAWRRSRGHHCKCRKFGRHPSRPLAPGMYEVTANVTAM